jgi:hypothetical protein
MPRINNPCTLCGAVGIPGLIRGAGKCQAHWNNGAHGTPMPETLIFTRVASDTNGNPRYRVDGDSLLTAEEMHAIATAEKNPVFGRLKCRARAAKRANSVGGRKWPGSFVFVFQSYSIQATADAIGRVTGRTFIAEKG